MITVFITRRHDAILNLDPLNTLYYCTLLAVPLLIFNTIDSYHHWVCWVYKATNYTMHVTRLLYNKIGNCFELIRFVCVSTQCLLQNDDPIYENNSWSKK